MLVRKGFKYRLKPDAATKQKFVQHAGACRFVWNKLLAINDARYISYTPRLGFADGCKLLTLWKQSDEYGFLADVHSQALQQCLKDLERAYTNLFAGRADPPSYRKKFLSDSFRFPQGFKVEGNHVYLPKIGWVPFWLSRDIEGTVKNVTVSRRGEHWYVSFQVEIEMPDPLHPSESAIGIDMGIATFAAFSDGHRIEPLNSFRKWEAKLAKEQRQLALKVKFSNNWIKQKRKVNRIHQKIANLRHGFLHQHSTEISALASLQGRSKPRSRCRRGLAGVQYVQVGQRHGRRTGPKRGGKVRVEQGDSRSGMGHVPHHAGVQTALAWRHGDCRPAPVHVANVCRMRTCIA